MQIKADEDGVFWFVCLFVCFPPASNSLRPLLGWYVALWYSTGPASGDLGSITSTEKKKGFCLLNTPRPVYGFTKLTFSSTKQVTNLQPEGHPSPGWCHHLNEHFLEFQLVCVPNSANFT
jgi:hypothetical protein